ncbi:calmodulin-A-like [Ruditapes philippinarum]|uniref:calmodulin-A-like n=1 Tax=Ruditapes philippinarum TaxID=129788 RepID=UPI00295B4D8A|nr:calmodulin-A-like [Ruditapes philippinarum]
MPLTGVKLNAKQQEELKEAFIIYDSDGDGKVTREQATCVIRSIALSPTNEELNSMLGDRERLFSLNEIQTIIATKAPPFETEENLKEAFSIFDKDGNGYVDVKEIRHVLVHLGEKLKDDQVDEMLRDVEISGDNQFNFEEMVRTIQCLY